MSVTFGHDLRIRDAFPALSAGALLVDDVETLQRPDRAIEDLQAAAAGRLEEHTESEFPEIQAWRRAFAQMGLKPTQYRCAAEALLRRVRKQGALPQLHPLVDLCNAASVAAAVPVAVFDRHAITTELVVRPAAGGEDYLTFSGEHENPDVDEVIYADTAGHAHARRWTNRQSARSATHPDTRAALIVVEALHEDGENTITTALNSITDALTNNGHPAPRQHVLSLQQPTIAW